MTCSIARERYTPLLNSPRNFDGIVSRCLASSVCSKVPVKAKAHGRRERSQSIRGGGVGGAPPPRNGFAAAKYPTSSHSATSNPHAVPPADTDCEKTVGLQGILLAVAAGRIRPEVQDALQRRDLHARLQSAVSPPASRGTAWEESRRAWTSARRAPGRARRRPAAAPRARASARPRAES